MILVLSEIFPPQTGGSGRWLYEIYSRFPAGEVVVAAGEHPGAAEFDAVHGHAGDRKGDRHGVLAEPVPFSGLKIVRLPLGFGGWGMLRPAGIRGYCRALRAVKAVVGCQLSVDSQIHCGKVLPEGWIAWMLHKLGGPPYVCYVHGEELNVVGTSRELRWMARRVLAGAGLVVANSRNTARLLSEGWPVHPERLRILHPGVDAERFRPARRDERVRRELGWSGRTVILTVGRLQRRKGQDMLIRALPQIAAAVPDVLYAIVGDGQDRGRLESLAGKGDGTHLPERHPGKGDRHGVLAEPVPFSRVQFLGEPDDARLVECYQQCDLFALPNRTVDGDIEGFGMVLVEAQACGKAVLAGDSGGTAETMVAGSVDRCQLSVVSEDDSPLTTHHSLPTGLIADCTRPEPLAAAVIELLSDRDRLEAMGRAGRERVLEHFDWPALVEQAREMFGLGGGDVPAGREAALAEAR